MYTSIFARLTTSICFVAALSIPASPASATLIRLFGTDNAAGGTIVGDTFTLTHSALVADGVTFDATLTIVGTPQVGGGPATLIQNTTDLGLDTGILMDSTFLDNGESLTLSMAISNEIGGTVAFNGFTEVDLNNFGAIDSGVLSLDNDASTAGDNFFVAPAGADVIDISGTLPTVFSIIPDADGLSSNTLGLGDVSAQFTGTAAVPEPSSLLMMIPVGLAALHLNRIRRRKGQTNSSTRHEISAVCG